jgi:hypothetical protein
MAPPPMGVAIDVVGNDDLFCFNLKVDEREIVDNEKRKEDNERSIFFY